MPYFDYNVANKILEVIKNIARGNESSINFSVQSVLISLGLIVLFYLA